MTAPVSHSARTSDVTRRPSLLQAIDLTAGFGANQVLHGVSLDVSEGEIVGIFGLNGAGKSVTMKVLAGLIPAWSGRVVFDGDDVTDLPTEARVARGIGNVPQGRQVFPGLTVDENLRLGAYTSRRRDRPAYPARLDRVFEQFPILADRRSQLAGTLSGGQQASLAVARALINGPRLVLVDEPSAGLAPVIVRELYEILHGVRESGVTMLLVEQNVSFGLSLVDRANILQQGRVVYEGGVGDLDQDRLARLLGIGRMLAAGTDSALDKRRPAPKDRPRRRPRVATRAATKKRAAAKKRAATKKRAPSKKRAATKKRAPKKRGNR